MCAPLALGAKPCQQINKNLCTTKQMESGAPPVELEIVPSRPFTTQDEVTVQIKEIFAKNQLDDLNRFIAKRSTLNRFTTFLMYGSYVFQSSGIFITTLATGYSLPELTWVGIGLNMMSTLMIVFEKLNTSISTKILKDIQSIRNGTYVDEGIIVDDTKKDEEKSK
jgi:hypothetical protein